MAVFEFVFVCALDDFCADTEGSFMPERVRTIAEAFMAHVSALARVRVVVDHR